MKVKLTKRAAVLHSALVKRDLTNEVFTATVDSRVDNGIDRSRFDVIVPYKFVSNSGDILDSIHVNLGPDSIILV